MDDVFDEEEVRYSHKMKEPLISLVLPTKNSLPHVKDTIDALKKQTYRNFELIVQDGGSTDGTLEFLESITDLPNVKIESKPDNGIGDAYGLGMERSHGDFLCFIASDERLLSNSLKIGMGWFKKFPNAAFIIGSVELINGKKKKIFNPKPYHFLKVMSCEYVPPISGILSRKVIGEDFYYDRTLKTCPDYDLWLRLGTRFSENQLIIQPEVFMRSLADRSSMSYRVESIEQFWKDKCFILDRMLKQRPELEEYRNRGMEGICRWASSTACEIDPESELCMRFANKAEEWSKKEAPPPSDFRVIRTYVKEQYSKIFGFKIFTKLIITLRRLVSSVDNKICSFLVMFINKLSKKNAFVGEKSSWGNIVYYSVDKSSSNWVKISLEVYYGAVSICFMNGSALIKQKVFYKQSHEIETYFDLSDSSVSTIVFRNGGVPHSSFRINELSIIEAK